MDSIKLMMKTKEELIRELVIIKVKKYLSVITEEEFVSGVVDIYSNNCYCEIVEFLSHVVFDSVVESIDKLRDTEVQFKVLFKEEVEVNIRDYSVTKICDVVILSNTTIEVIKFVFRDSDIIKPHETSEMKLLGAGILNKYLPQANSKYINLTVIQPNILVTSTFHLTVEDLLHEVEYTLM